MSDTSTRDTLCIRHWRSHRHISFQFPAYEYEHSDVGSTEWDVCTDFGDDPMGMDYDKDEIPWAEDNLGPIDNEHSMEPGPSSVPLAPQGGTTDQASKVIESSSVSSALQVGMASPNPIANENSMDIESPPSCLPPQLGLTVEDPKVIELTSDSLVPPPKTSSSHTPALASTSASASTQHQWIDTHSADYDHFFQIMRIGRGRPWICHGGRNHQLVAANTQNAQSYLESPRSAVLRQDM